MVEETVVKYIDLIHVKDMEFCEKHKKLIWRKEIIYYDNLQDACVILSKCKIRIETCYAGAYSVYEGYQSPNSTAPTYTQFIRLIEHRTATIQLKDVLADSFDKIEESANELYRKAKEEIESTLPIKPNT